MELIITSLLQGLSQTLVLWTTSQQLSALQLQMRQDQHYRWPGRHFWSWQVPTWVQALQGRLMLPCRLLPGRLPACLCCRGALPAWDRSPLPQCLPGRHSC